MEKIVLMIFVVLFSFSSRAADAIHLIFANGIVEKSVEPNMVVLKIEAWARATTAKAAQDLQKVEYVKVKSAIDKYKIKKEDFQTENFSANPEYVYDHKTQSNKITGYRVTHRISVTFRRIEEAGSLVDSLSSSSLKADAGGVSVQSILWDYDKKDVIETAALNEAVRTARAKAEDLAKAAGVKIKAVHRVQHTSAEPISRAYEMKAMVQSDSDKSGGSRSSTELVGGQVKVRVEVQMEFEI